MIMANTQPDRTYQYFCTFGSTIGAFVGGSAAGWSSSSELVFEKHYPQLTQHDIHILDGAIKLGAAVAQACLGFLVFFLGSRLTLLLTSVPYAAGWLLLATGDSMEELALGRFVVGFCLGATCVAAPIYIGEISDRYVRGMLCEIFSLAATIGTFFAYCLGEFESMGVLTWPFFVCCIIMFIVLLFLPESPVDLYCHGHIEAAGKSLHVFRGEQYNIDEELNEIKSYSAFARDNFWKDLFRYASVKAGIILIVMHCLQQLTGIYIIIMHAYRLCKMTKVFKQPNHGAIILGVVQVVFSLISTAVVDKIGRRPLWIVSLGMMAGAHIYIAQHFQANSEMLSVRPLIAMSILLAAFCLGVGPLPFVMIAELLPKDVKHYISSIALIFNWLLGFAVIMTFQPIVESKGAPYLFYSYALFCVMGIIFVALVVVETKHKSLEDIQQELEGKGPRR